jgi:hypothetical protein
MKMIRDKCPAKTTRIGLLNNPTKPIQKIIAVSVVPKNLRTFDSPDDNVMQSSRRIYPRLPRHNKRLP